MIFQKKQTMLAVSDGELLPLDQVQDEAFSSGLLGVGFAIEPSMGVIHSPVDGFVEGVAETGHAYTLHTKEGLDVLVHVGIDTVSLGGKGFSPLVKVGDRVKAGDVLANVELEILRAKGLACTVPVLVTNPEALQQYSCKSRGRVIGGKDAVMEYRTS